MFFSASQHNLERGPINPLQIGVINLGWVVWLNWWNRLWFGMLTLCICWWVWYKKAGINGWESLQHCLKINEYHEWNATGVLEIWELKNPWKELLRVKKSWKLPSFFSFWLKCRLLYLAGKAELSGDLTAINVGVAMLCTERVPCCVGKITPVQQVLQPMTHFTILEWEICVEEKKMSKQCQCVCVV